MKKKSIQIIKSNAPMVATALLLVVTAVFLSGFSIQSLYAQESVEELREQTQSIDDEIQENLERIHELEEQETSLNARIEQLDLEVDVANQQINRINVQIEEIEIEIDEAQKELDRQNTLIANSLRLLYKRGQVSTIELIAGSDSFGDFINEQEYLSQIKIGISESAAKIEELRETLQERKDEQVVLLDGQQAQRDLAEAKAEEQEKLLADTQGQQDEFEDIVEGLREDRAQAQRELEAFLATFQATGNVVSLGEVKRGDQIGEVGSTGFSTGPHLHFVVSQNGVIQNPVAGNQILAHELSWPLVKSSWAQVTQGYGCVAPAGFYNAPCNGGANSIHSGLDVSGWYGDPILAAADGDIVFRGWQSGFGNTVIIDHGNGILTQYAHLNN